MKNVYIFSAALAIAVAPFTRAQPFTDMFTGSTSNWQAIAAFSDSSAIQSDGALTLSNGGKVVTAKALATPVDVTLKFRFAGSQYDNLRVVTRTDGATTGGEFARGIVFHIQMRTDTGSQANNVYIHNAGGVIAQATYPIAHNQDYTVRIVDDGSNLLFYINNLTSPLLQATDSTAYGTKVGLRNREGAGAGSFISSGSQVKISAFTATATSVVKLTETVTMPDPRSHMVNFSCLGSGGFTLGFVIGSGDPKKMLIRAVGPTLAQFGVPNVAPEATITIYSGQTPIRYNSGWSTAPNAVEIAEAPGPFPLANGSRDSAVLLSLSAGAYTAQTNGQGAILIEAYEVP